MAERASGTSPLDALSALARDLFEPLGVITVRRMFGGAGVYSDGVMFALLADTIYLKTDSTADALFDAAGDCPRFRPSETSDATMAYRRLPDTALDDPDEALEWGRVGRAAALRGKQPKRTTTPRKASRRES